MIFKPFATWHDVRCNERSSGVLFFSLKNRIEDNSFLSVTCTCDVCFSQAFRERKPTVIQRWILTIARSEKGVCTTCILQSQLLLPSWPTMMKERRNVNSRVEGYPKILALAFHTRESKLRMFHLFSDLGQIAQDNDTSIRIRRIIFGICILKSFPGKTALRQTTSKDA